PVGPDQRDVLPPLEPQFRAIQQHARRSAPVRATVLAAPIGGAASGRGAPPLSSLPPSHLPPRVDELKDHATRPLGRLERKLQPLPIARITLDALDLRELLDPRLRLSRLRRLVAEALDKALHPRDLGLLLVDRLPQRHLARRLLATP